MINCMIFFIYLGDDMLNWSELIYHIYNLDYEIMITSHKINQDKLWKSIPNQPNIKLKN
jgi:hypothetical protein